MGGLSGLFKSRSSTTTLDPLLTQQQQQAQQMLAQLSSSGQYGDINLGEAYKGSLGDFNQTGTQTDSTNRLYDLINILLCCT